MIGVYVFLLGYSWFVFVCVSLHVCVSSSTRVKWRLCVKQVRAGEGEGEVWGRFTVGLRGSSGKLQPVVMYGAGGEVCWCIC